ncbi:MAG: methylenetetrahydrofolate--tRNA-(uracil(54)-C(5))-methyltransferase (FADH(2)-oxidizing) TrmFO [Polyangiaceae bacterium]
MPAPIVTIVGAGLAGCELALQLARAGYRVRLHEQKPERRSEAATSDYLAELVCSNSFRGAALTNAVGLLKEEMRRLGSFVMKAADATRLPAGGALAVDRDSFSSLLTEWVHAEPNIELVRGELREIPEARPLVIATGPLTSDAFAQCLEARLGTSRVSYYDAIAPVVAADSIDYDKVFFASRWDKGETEEDKTAYLNCPFEKAEYFEFVAAIVAAEKVEPRNFEKPKYFEGCLPVEVMAERGPRTLAFGPMKPVGITDPRTGRRPYAVVQLRRENQSGTAYNLVGFQSRMKQPEQGRVFRMIPGLEKAEFLRWGSVHRNTFIDSPSILDGMLRLRSEPSIYFAGQITGVEGYVESAASGLACSFLLRDELEGRTPTLPPETTALGGLLRHLASDAKHFQPSNVTFALVAPLPDVIGKKRSKDERGTLMAERALADSRTLARSQRRGTCSPLRRRCDASLGA